MNQKKAFRAGFKKSLKNATVCESFLSKTRGLMFRARNYKKPLLIIHSSEDKVIPFEMGQTLFNKANAPKELYVVKNCHICGPKFYSDSIAEKIKNMIK